MLLLLLENGEHSYSVEEGGGTKGGFVPAVAQNHHSLLPVQRPLQAGMNFTPHLNGPTEKHFTTLPLIAQKYEPSEANSRGLIDQYHNIRQLQHNGQFNEDPHSATGTLHYRRQPYKSKLSRKQDHNDSNTSERTSSNQAINYKDAQELFCQTIFPDSSQQGSENEILRSTIGSFLHGQHIIGEPIEQNHQHVCNYKCLLQCYQIQAKDLRYPNMKLCQPQRNQQLLNNLKHDIKLSDFVTTANDETDLPIDYTDTNYEKVVDDSESINKPSSSGINTLTCERNPEPNMQCRGTPQPQGHPRLSLKMHRNNMVTSGQTNVEKAKNVLYSKQLGAPEEFSVAQPNPMKYVGDKDKIMQQNNLQLKYLYHEESPRQKYLTIDDRRLPVEKDQHNPSENLKSADTLTQNKAFGNSSFHPKTSHDEDMEVPDKTFDYTTKSCKTPEYLPSYPPKQYFSSLEDNSEDAYNSSVYKNKKFKSSYLKQHRETEDRQVKLTKINQILEDFIPAMRTTNIPTAFVWQLIDLHKTGCSNGFNAREELCKPLKTQERDDGNRDVKEKLNKKELLKYFNVLEESFVKFARSHIVFKSLCEKDQMELLKRNSILFVMVRSMVNNILHY